MTPITSRERIEILDVLRGLALFGIITANMRAFNSPQAAYFDHSLMWQGVGDRIAQGFIDLFVTGKFVTLFSLLFGIGFAVQMETEERLVHSVHDLLHDDAQSLTNGGVFRCGAPVL